MPLNFRQEKAEADLRYSLVRLRENSERWGARMARGKGHATGSAYPLAAVHTHCTAPHQSACIHP